MRHTGSKTQGTVKKRNGVGLKKITSPAAATHYYH